MTGEHPCATEACSAPAKPGQLMCWPCWKRLPQALQRKVNSTWRNYRRDPQAYTDARDEAVRWQAEHPPRAAQQGRML